jgi:hypothetical protein
MTSRMNGIWQCFKHLFSTWSQGFFSKFSTSSKVCDKASTWLYLYTHTHTPIPTHRSIYQLLLASVTKNILVAHRLNSRLSQTLFLFVHVAHVANGHCGKWPNFRDLWKWRHVQLAYQQIAKAHMSNFFGL